MTHGSRPQRSFTLMMLSLLGGFTVATGCSSSTTAVIPKVVTPEMEQGLEDERRRAAEQEAEAEAARKEREQSARQR